MGQLRPLRCIVNNGQVWLAIQIDTTESPPDAAAIRSVGLQAFTRLPASFPH